MSYVDIKKQDYKNPSTKNRKDFYNVVGYFLYHIGNLDINFI